MPPGGVAIADQLCHGSLDLACRLADSSYVVRSKRWGNNVKSPFDPSGCGAGTLICEGQPVQPEIIRLMSSYVSLSHRSQVVFARNHTASR